MDVIRKVIDEHEYITNMRNELIYLFKANAQVKLKVLRVKKEKLLAFIMIDSTVFLNEKIF